MFKLISSPREIFAANENYSSAEKEMIKKAFDFAQEAHAGQKRKSGEPYFNHTYSTALILAELGMDAATICAGLLHDTIEDTDVTEEDVQKEFGEEILFLVNGVTKLGTIRFEGAKRHIESLRKLFIASSNDLRVLIIKLADRLHNMRTLQYVSEEKQVRIATETMEIYAPIAHRLNMGKIKGELEDLAFPFIYPKEYQELLVLAKDRYRKSERSLKKIHERVVEELKKENITMVVTDYRRKHLWSLYQKLKRKEMDIDQVYDISALRIIVKTVSDCYRTLGVIHSIWRPLPGRIKDYIAFPKPNGYQSIHTTVFTSQGDLAEVQIRTETMHQDAEFGIASHFGYRNNKNKGHALNLLPISWIRQLLPKDSSASPQDKDEEKDLGMAWVKEIAEEQKDIATPAEFMQNLREDFFSDRIFVSTPNGDVIDLPVGSTPIDFAYKIHTNIGDHISDAKINGKLSKLSTVLNNSDVVEITTSKNSSPRRKWLDSAVTALARRRIRAAIQKQEKENPKG